MQNFDELIRFRRCRNVHGSAVPVTIGRRNGKPAVFLSPDLREPIETSPSPLEFAEQNKFFVNLNSVESQTWRKILKAQSIASIAKEEGVSRQAIYARIEGNSKGQGGMIGKNFWVLLYWRLRQRIFHENSHD